MCHLGFPSVETGVTTYQPGYQVYQSLASFFCALTKTHMTFSLTHSFPFYQIKSFLVPDPRSVCGHVFCQNVSVAMSGGASLPHKATIGSGSEQPGRYYSPNPAPIIQARESERHRERGRAEDEVIPNSATARVTASL